MKTIKNLFVFFGFGLILTLAANQAQAKNPSDTKDTARRQIVGTWQLKESAAKSRIEKMKASKTVDLFVAAPIPNSVILAADDEFGEITINEGFEKVIHTQTLSLKNGETETSFNSGVKSRAFWQNKKLIVESSVASGAKMTQIFELTGKNQLKVTLRLEDSKMPKAIVARRVYERQADEQAGAGEAAAAVNISQYLL